MLKTRIRTTHMGVQVLHGPVWTAWVDYYGAVASCHALPTPCSPSRITDPHSPEPCILPPCPNLPAAPTFLAPPLQPRASENLTCARSLQ
jgi:hypothetical protein